MQNNNPNSRIDYLDAMRGVAAMMVLVGHYINWIYKDKIIIKCLSFVFNANDAVSFFFVLSGFVLSYSFLQNKSKELPINKFYVNRIFRLLPGFITALVIGLLYYNRHNLTLENGLDIFIRNKYQFWEEFFLFRGYNNIYLPGWTLSIEMGMSFLIPYFIIIARYNRKLILPFAAATLLAANISGFFVFHFILGICISAFYNEIVSDKFKEMFLYKQRFILLPLAVVLFSMRGIERFSELGYTLKYILNYLKIDTFVFTALASALFIVYTIHFTKVKRFFQNPILLFYGKISYGIYLIHWVFVIAFYDHWNKLLVLFNNNVMLLFIAGLLGVLLATTISAMLIYYIVEKPFIKLGKRITRKMKDKWVVKPE